MSVDGRDESLGDGGAEIPPQVPSQGGPSRGAPGRSRSGGAAGPGVPAQRDGSALPPSDAELIRRMRDGDDTAYEELYRRHAGALRRYARSCCRDAHTADDLTAEVFARMLQAVRAGAGPEHAVRAYLLTTVRRVAASWTKSAKREQLVDDFAAFATQAARLSEVPDDAASSGPFGTGVDLGAEVRALHEAERSLARQAFRSLPERWQAVLWHTEVEDEPPSEVATLFGLDANGTRVLASRAREGLRQAYLQAHVSAALTTDEECARYADRLGTYARRGLRTRAERGLRKHLRECARCRLAAIQIEEVASSIPAVVPVAVIGWFGAAGYAKAAAIIAGSAGAGAAGAAGAVATGAGATAGGGSGGASAGGGAAASEAAAGASVKVLVAAGVAAVAATTVVLASVDHHHGPSGKSEAGLPAIRTVESRKPTPAPTHRTPQRQHLGPPAAQPSSAAPAPRLVAAARALASTPTPSAAPTSTSAGPPVRTGPSPAPGPSSTPVPTATPTPKPTPTPAPSAPAPTVYPWNELPYDATGDGTGPEMRFAESSWVWQRWGMSIDGRQYPDGVTVHGSSSVTIDLNRPCSSFDALVGVDDLTDGPGKVRFSVFVDGARVWRSPQIKNGRPAVPVHVGLGGHRTVRMVVESHAPRDRAALADWAESRFTC